MQSTAKDSEAQHSTAQHSTAQHSTAQHSTAQHTAHRQGSSQSRLDNSQRRRKQLMKDRRFLEEVGAEEVLRGSCIHEQLVHASKQQLQAQHTLSTADLPMQGTA